MGPWKKLMGFLGFGNQEEENDTVEEEINSHRNGFGVKLPVVNQIAPLLVPCLRGDGGLQGLRWYSKRLKVDEDGDVAHEFIEEVFLETTSNTAVHCKQFPIFEVKLNTKNAKARNPVLSNEGKIQQYVEFRGRLFLV
ncbi:hypothetical protein CTI12_AA171310 [Artemisia annua]|uniref:Uncharacterized protein n=1 Tax=Artemisia annua TaxID=35608 RepID=A0A2U1P5G2_ARTAN|nr:hypothetical protein CTI12_AA171310 [Artemisia annua]